MCVCSHGQCCHYAIRNVILRSQAVMPGLQLLIPTAVNCMLAAPTYACVNIVVTADLLHNLHAICTHL